MSDGSYSFELLHEIVADKDQFSDQTHEKVSETLFKLIDASDKGITVGLEGGWGAGKSTVVKLLRDKLEATQDNKTLVFLFDAWAHDGDPLRRIFLESLIHEIDPDGKDNDLINLSGEVSGRKKTVTVTTKKTPSKLGKRLSLSALFVPAGAAILSAVDYSNLLLPFAVNAETINWAFCIGLFLSLTPTLPLIHWALSVKQDKDMGKWAVLEASSTENYSQDITEDSERTSIEFERFFKQILEMSVGKDKKFNRILIVIDNLDRVQPEHAQAIWSVLQTFFQCRSNGDQSSQEDWAKNLWFLVPYDREGLSRIWEQQENPSRPKNETSHEVPASPAPILDHDDNHQSIAKSFIDKCFQVIAEVPEPVFSAWVEYFEDCANAALSHWPKNEKLAVIETYKRYESRLGSSPTPRKILKFINQVGMQGMRWGANMSGESMALYALLRQNLSDSQLRAKLLVDGLPYNYDSTSESHDLKMQLAGMLFGVDKSKGIQLLLEPEIYTALRNGDSDKIATLIDEQEEAFWIVWQAIRASRLPSGHIEEYRISVTKAICIGAAKYPDKIANDVKHLENEWKSKHAKWELDKYDYSEALTALIASLKEPSDFISWLKEQVQKELQHIVSSIGEDTFKPAGLQNIEKLSDILVQSDPIQDMHYEKLTAVHWPTWVDTIEAMGVSMPYVLPEKTAISDMGHNIHPTNPVSGLLNALNVAITLVPKNTGWEAVSDHLVAWGVNPRRSLNEESAYSLMLKLYSSQNEEIKNKIKNCVANQNFVNRSSHDAPESAPSLLALYSTIYGSKLLSSNISENVKEFWKSDLTFDECQPVISAFIENGALSNIWTLAADPDNKVAISIIKNQKTSDLYGTATGALFIGLLDWASEKDREEITNNLSKYGAIEAAKNSFINNPQIFFKSIRIIKTYGDQDAQKIIDSVITSITKQDWVDSFTSETDLFECIAGKGNHKYKDGFKEFIQAELATENSTSYVWDRFDDFVAKLQDSEEVIGGFVEKYFQLGEDNLSNEAFNTVSQSFSKFIKQTNSRDLMGRIEYWLDNEQWKRIEWLLDCKFSFAGEVKESLITRIKEHLVSPDTYETQVVILKRVAKVFHIEIEPATKVATD